MVVELTPALRERAGKEPVIWLTTVSPSGQPMPRPVWFVWDGDEFVIYTYPGAAKVAHIDANPKVTLHFDDNQSGEIYVLIGRAERVAEPMPPSRFPGYLDKYRDSLPEINYTVAELDATMTIALRIGVHRLWGPS
ncbi:PPOX class probable F420-dependent enzyme [Lipingzhangella halophila]|uniref:PPOX class probable F420-dependent enzyme n=1 Tax=Lipingzhangella halophila TaxID=1783352 RepID=A0A7W7RM55_9ACTN|nr:TIGR03667 family PPOX class F420-dependent oxidoreductase [Lipingzhangella halophila]MBB4934103.1 PPOX class probable F420-dependent enzyme [Lipingzhangella halophila]